MKVTVVVPTIRENSIQRFLEEWNVHFSRRKVTVIVVEDNLQKTFEIKPSLYKFKLLHYAWSDIENDLGKDSWIIPRRSSAIKAYGFMRAYHLKSDVIISLDDDCYPLEKYIPKFNKKDFVRSHLDALFINKEIEEAWFPTMQMFDDVRPRGLPYKNVKRIVSPNDVFLSHGLWANVPDFDGTTQLKVTKIPTIEQYFVKGVVPRHTYFPMCGMNIAWKREITPALYFMLMGKDAKDHPWGFDRFDDIWAGVFAKKICDHLGYRIVSGSPVIWHDRASNPHTNVQKEKTGVVVNEKLWEVVDAIELRSDSVIECYKEIARKLPGTSDYFKKLKKAMIIWANLFDK